VATVVVVMLSTLPTGLIAIGSDPPQGIVLGFVIGGIIGSLVYCAGFLWLSIATSRALIVGLLYVFIWEGVVVNLFSGVRFLSVRQYTLGIAGAFINAPRSVFAPDLAAASAFVLSALATVLAVWFAVRGLRRWEIGEAS
jgi:ABC-2 type transport system permease protein